jgi:predicted AAA+ superfamily ATPase
MIRRKAQNAVKDWIDNGKDAFLITGARQIGKTYLIRQCLKESGIPYIELNFIEQPELVELFQGAKDVKEILMRLSLVVKEPLKKGKTILFLDEIQEFKDIVTRIKFLVEEGSFRYIMSGSLLGVELNDLRSAPVGYMRIYDMYPLDFKEFAQAAGVHDGTFEQLYTHFKERTPVDEFVHAKMLDVFYLYLIIGGMPEAVSTYIETNDLAQVAQVHNKIIRLYKKDFSKYEHRYKLKLQEIYDAMPGQLDQKNKRFQLNSLGKGISYDRVANDFLWLKDAGVAIPVYNISEPKSPLIISENRNLFKLFFSDVGLLTSCYSNQVKVAILNKDKSINNGALFENAVVQELLSKGHKVYYFNSKKQGELDFVIELDGKVTPLEIKSGKEYKKHSALNNVLQNEEYQIAQAYIFSEGNVEVSGEKIYMPVYMTAFLENTPLSRTIYKLDLRGL